ncbi:ANP1/MMN9/VAN1 family protein KNAG_0A03990 [Huiozyma naganishii CBS 8797]|uniref:Uncharacterized protein n=1 Tax=Huiozyma naganishii (strain ATCC MYA-139 / BCRC 22969 / CBS 8797 / KCTC 17520 / NBRC 10181 / NCYC 3082 / Yp74L-3) TaxID=1071383 RepID=J7REU2_HUIN7|nr:hypothetical protein KNAG_0A03990 [Kazachstania naganishii CBS 8797]CCK68078.1 hypothetical protein KNAG_0A03990 [Kazachstania naganishii CBS 8797]
MVNSKTLVSIAASLVLCLVTLPVLVSKIWYPSILGFHTSDLLNVDSLEREGTYYFSYASPFTKEYQYKDNRGAVETGGISYYNLNELAASPDAEGHSEHILVLIPLINFNSRFFENLFALTYPKQLIDLGVIVPDSKNATGILQALQETLAKVQANDSTRYNKITVLKDDNKWGNTDDPVAYRKQLAALKNQLLFSTLPPYCSWVLWLDSQITGTPTTLVQDLANHGKAILTTHIFNNSDGSPDSETLNNWVASDTWRSLATGMPHSRVVIEGVSHVYTDRPLMGQFYDAAASVLTEMELDSVSTACTLVKAEVHRDGAMFPNFAFHHLVETEGFARMARLLKHQAFGLPNYVVHRG